MYFKPIEDNCYSCFIGDVPLHQLYMMKYWLNANNHLYEVTCDSTEVGYRLWLKDRTLVTVLFFLISKEKNI